MKKGLKIGVAGGCGGLGKSTLALTLAKYFNGYLITNDPTNPLGNVYSNFKYMKSIKIIENDNYNFIYDFAGHLTPEIIEASNKCDVFIIITDNTTHAINGANLLKNNIKNKNKFIVFNSLGNSNLEYNKNRAYDDYVKVSESKAFKDIEVLPLKFTKRAFRCIDNGDSLYERTLTKSGKINLNYKLENAQLLQIFNRVENNKYSIKINKI